jgi:hypothetical protein
MHFVTARQTSLRVCRFERSFKTLAMVVVLATLGASPSFGAVDLNAEFAKEDFLFSESGEYFLSDNLVISGVSSGDTIFGNFSGSFNGSKADGGTYLISGLNKPLFNQLLPGASISNLSISGLINSITGLPAGILATSTETTIDGDDSTPDISTTISNVHVSGEISSSGNYLGGMIGISNGGTISNSSSAANVSSSYNQVGGLIGASIGTNISNSTSSGVISGSYYVGGLVGQTENVTIERASSSGMVNGSYATGGLIGYDGAGTLTVTNSSSSSDVNGATSSGGIVGYLFTGSISNSIFTGDVSGGEDIGGIVGNAQSAAITNSVFNGVISSGSSVGGIAGEVDSYSEISSSQSTGTIEGSSFVGGIAGDNNGVIENSLSDLTLEISGDVVGGAVGINRSNGVIRNVRSSSNVFGAQQIGGLVGINVGTVNNSISTGNVGDLMASRYIGGLVGYLAGGIIEPGLIRDSFAIGDVYAPNARDVGGLAGYSQTGTIERSTARGDVVGTDSTGGLIGYSYLGTISESEATGDVIGLNYVGGFIGDRDSTTITNSVATGDVIGLNYVGTFIGSATWGTIAASRAIGANLTSPNTFIGNEWGVGITDSGNFEGEVTLLEIPTNELITLNYGFEPEAPAWAKDVNSYINSGNPYLIALLDSGFYSDSTPDPDPIDPGEPSGGGSGGGSGSIKKPISPEEIAKREGSERKILENLKENFRKIEVEDFKSAGIVGVTEKSLSIVVELLAELEIETFEAPTVQKVVQIAGAISRIISVDQGKSISFLDLKKVGVTEIEYSELKEFSKFLALLPADKKNSIKEIQLLVAEFKKNKEAVIKAREAKKEATRIQREKNLQLILSMFKK